MSNEARSSCSDSTVTVVPARGRRYPLMPAAVLVVVGIILGDWLAWTPVSWVVIAGLAAILAAAIRMQVDRRYLAIAAIALTFLGLGGWRIAVEQENRPSESLLQLTESSQPVEGFGRLAGVPYRKGSGWRAPFELSAIRGSSGVVPLRARLLLSTREPLSGFRHGDYLRLLGRFQRPFVRRNPGGFDYASHLRRQGIDALIRPVGLLTHVSPAGSAWRPENLVEPVRQWIRRALSDHLAQRPRALLLGFLLGDTDELPADIFTAFRESGTLHLLAVSGANVWLIVGIFYWPLRLLSVSRWPRTIFLILVIVAFAFLTRNEPSVVRASLVAGMMLIGRLIGRPATGINAVAAAALLILLVSPEHLFRPGFQLSFAAVLGIAVVLRRFPMVRRGIRRNVAVLALSSLAASAATMPIIAWHFGTVPIMGVVANLVMVPLAGIVAQAALIFLPLSALWPGGAGLLAVPLSWSAQAAIASAQFFAALPGSVLPWPNPAPVLLLLWYLALALGLSWRYRYTFGRPLTYAALALMLLGIGRQIAGKSDVAASIALLDTGGPRVVAVADHDGDVVWIVDDPGIDPDLMQWVVAPFRRFRYGTDKPGSQISWRRGAEDHTRDFGSLRSGTDDTVGWRMYVSGLRGSASGRKVWSDCIGVGADTVVLLRDLPRDGSRVSGVLPPVGTGHLVVVPAHAADASIRQAITHLDPRQVILYGKRPGSWRPDQTLARWRIRYPQIDFWSTAVHGGIMIDLGRSGLRVTPTVKETR